MIDQLELLETVDLGTVDEDERICWDCRCCCKRRHASICNVVTSCIFDLLCFIFFSCVGFNVGGLMEDGLILMGVDDEQDIE